MHAPDMNYQMHENKMEPTEEHEPIPTDEHDQKEEHDLDAMNNHDISPEAMLEFKMETADVQEDPLSSVDQCLVSEAQTTKSTKVARYSCDQCNYAAHRLASVKRHKESVHEGIRYKCDECDYSATNKSYLKAHKETKHDGLLYQCDLCDHTAKSKGILRKHKKLKHGGTGDILSCDLCEFTCIDRSKLKCHQESVHEGVKYPCDQCDYAASQLGSGIYILHFDHLSPPPPPPLFHF